MGDVGYSQQIKTEIFGRSRRRVADEARRKKSPGDIPPFYPNGWFAILESDELKAEGVRSVNLLGKLTIPHDRHMTSSITRPQFSQFALLFH